MVLFTAWSVLHIQYNGKLFPEPISKGIIAFATLPSNVYHAIVPSSVPYNIFDARQITDSISKKDVVFFADSSIFPLTKLLISTFKSSKEVEFKLIQLPDKKIIKSWLISISTNPYIFKNINSTTRYIHPLMTNDSSLIIKEAKNSLISVSSTGKIRWIDSNYVFHHSIEQENDSTIWIPSVAKEFKYYKIEGFSHDAISAVDPRNGKIKFIKSVADILVENGYKALLDIGYDDDAIHLNDIQPALYTSKYWQKGDLLISLRNRNIVALYRPSNNKIIWLKTGPWLAQHDCDFVDGKTIMIFGNDVIWEKKELLVNGHNDIYFYDFEKDKISLPYNKVMKKLGIKTKSQGRCDILKNGDLFIDESENGKLYVINKDSVKMIYTERYDKNHIKMFNWVRPILN
jgi:hypothetical protein